MQLLRILLVCAVVGCSGAVSFGQPAPAGSAGKEGGRLVSLDECVRLALQNNLDIKIVRYGPQIAKFNLQAAYAGYDPVFSISGQHGDNTSPDSIDSLNRVVPGTVSQRDSFNMDLSGVAPTGLRYDFNGNVADATGRTGVFPFENTSGSAYFSLRQPLLKNFWIDSTRETIQIARHGVRSSELTVKNQLISTVTSVTLAYYSLVASREQVKVQETALVLANRLLEENQKRVQVGALAPLDEEQAKSEVAARRADLIAAQNQESVDQNDLKKLLSEDYSKWQDVRLTPSESLKAVPEPFNRLDSWQKGLSLRPDLLQSRIEVEKQGVVIKFQKNQLFPQLDLFGTYGHNGSKKEYSGAFGDISSGDAPFSSYGAVLSIPIGNRGARYGYRASKAQLDQQLLTLKKLERDIMVEIDDAIKQAQSSLERVEAGKQSVDFAESALRAEQKKLENGKSTSYQVLQLQRDLTSRRSDYIRSLADYNKALATLAAREGTTLERRNLGVEVK